MKRNISILSIILVFVLFSSVFADDKNATLVGWGIDKKNLDKFFARAEKVGFNVIITWSTDPIFLEKAVNAAKKYNIKIFSSLAPMGGMVKLWNIQYPKQAVPWQIMDVAENAAAQFLSAGKTNTLFLTSGVVNL